MSAGYELTEIRPEVEDYKAVPSAFRLILEYIFTDGFPHSIREVLNNLLLNASYIATYNVARCLCLKVLRWIRNVGLTLLCPLKNPNH